MSQGSVYWVGIDLHQESLNVAVYQDLDRDPLGERRFATQKGNLRKFLVRLHAKGEVRAVYEASGCGYWLARQIRSWGMKCEVAAPSLIPRRPGDKVKNDRRDARKLATLHRGGLLEKVSVPTPAQEDLRGLVRARESLRRDRHRARQRILKFLQARGIAYRDKGKRWSMRHRAWLAGLDLKGDAHETLQHYLFEERHRHELLAAMDDRLGSRAFDAPHGKVVSRLRCLRGIDTHSALVLACEVFDMKRFASPRRFMGWCGFAVTEYASSNVERRGHITRAGNRSVRRILTEAAWNNTRPPRESPTINERREGQPPSVVRKARQAERRLYGRWTKLTLRKDRRTAVTALARELAGYIWALWLSTPETLAMR